MSVDVLLPKLGAEMQSARIVSWNKAEGTKIQREDVLVTIETDKVTYDVEARASGILHIIAEIDQELPIGAVLARLAETAEEYQQLASLPANALPAATYDQSPRAAAQPVVSTTRQEPARRSQQERVRATPAARKAAKLHGIDIASLPSPGPGKLISEGDIRRFIESQGEARQTQAVERTPEYIADQAKPVLHRIPFKGIRRTIAHRLQQHLQKTAQMTDLGEIDVTNLVRHRHQLNEAQPATAKLTYTDFFAHFVALVLREFPQFNASLQQEEIVQWAEINVGVAVAIEGGLVVPVIRRADTKSLQEIHAELAGLIERARSATLALDDLTGGTFTLTNFGSYGTAMGTPLINPPQVAILGTGVIQQKPIVDNGQIVIRSMMGYALTCDHQVLDGAEAGQFMRRFRQLCETGGGTCRRARSTF